MDAQKALITNIFNNATLIEVPFFQRPYVWNEELWAKFNEDMEYVVLTRKPHFLGAIILKDAGLPMPGAMFAQRRTIVDGQQRLTTFLLFMKVLCLKQNQTAVFDLQFRIMGKDIALRHGKNDREAFEKAISAKTPEAIDNPAPGSRIIEAFNYFVEHVDPSKLDIMTIFMNAQFVKIDLSIDEDEQQIFDTINSLGVRLTTAELLKNYFYSWQDVSLYEKTWVEVFEKDADAQTYWNQEFEMGRMTRSLIDVFFDSYFQLFVQDSKFKVSTEDKIAYSRLEHLAKSYQDFIKGYCNGNKQVILEPMMKYANRFREVFDPDCVNRQMPKQSGIDRINVIIFGLKNATLIPYILYLACNVEDTVEFNKMLEILEAYIMRRMVIRATTKNYNNLFVSLILNQVKTVDALLESLKKMGDGTTYVPSDEELLDGFRTSKLSNLQAKGVIYYIESGWRSEKSAVALLGFKQYSLEHLMPRKWRNHWIPCETEELARKRDQKLQTLGNFAIITQSLNTSISDADWQTKKMGKKDNPGLNQCAAGLLTMEHVLSESVWNESCIDSRADWLWDKAKQLWASIAPAISDGTVIKGSTQSANTEGLRKRYWAYALPFIKKENLFWGAFSNVNPRGYNFVSGYFGLSGFRVDCVANYDAARIDFYLANGDCTINKATFDYLYAHKEEIEENLGVKMSWSRAEDNVASWIVHHLDGVSVGNEQDWPKMAAFHAEWSRKILDVMLPYLLPQNPAIEIGAWTREWAINRKDIAFDIGNCSTNYTRFTTGTMTEILPNLKNAPSAWNTESHYFYEINVMSSGKILMQLSINSKNITDAYRATCDVIQKLYPSKQNKAKANTNEWAYRLPFMTKPILATGLNKEDVFHQLDQWLEEVKDFEQDLKQKLSN